MQLNIATQKRIKELMKLNNMNYSYELSKSAGISLPTLLDFMKGSTKNLRSDTVLHICEAFHITLADFYSSPLFDDVISE